MKLRTVRYSLLAAAVAGAAVVSTPAAAEVSATAAIASIYLWRGVDLGDGAPAVSGSLDYAHDSGAFAGVWTSSGDANSGTEVDLYFGYGGKAGDFEYTAAYYYYAYPETNAPGDNADNDLKEIYLSGGMAGFKAEGFFGIGDGGSGDNKNNYFTLAYTKDKVTGKLGMTDNDTANTDYMHLDVSYAYNDNLSFTLSKVIDRDAGPKGDPLLQVSYAIPL